MSPTRKLALFFASFFLTSTLYADEVRGASQTPNYEQDLIRAVRCSSTSECVSLMTYGAINAQAEVIEAAAAKITGFSRPTKGDSTLARDYNKKGLKAFAAEDYRLQHTFFALATRPILPMWNLQEISAIRYP